MDDCWPVDTTGEGTDSFVAFPMYISILTSTRSTQSKSIVVWDIKTGVIVKEIVIDVQGLRRIVFIGNYTITLVTDYYKIFHTYDVLEGTPLFRGEILSQFDPWLGAHWAHEDSLRFATSFKAGRKLAINIHQLQPLSTPSLPMVESFLVPPHDGEFSFSPVSFHASFVTMTEIAILDVRDSKILLQIRAARPLYKPPGRFSPDGCLFACGTLGNEIYIWKKTSTGYVPGSSLEPRLPFEGFSFSPTAVSVLTWGPGGVQLLDNHFRFPSPDRTAPHHHHNCGDHLVAHSKDGTRIATGRRGDSVVTVLDLLSDAPQRSIDTAMRILDIGIVDNVIVVADTRELVSWHPEAGEIIRSAYGAIVAETAVVSTDPDVVEHFTLSTDCSWVAFTIERTVFLYDVQAQRILNKFAMEYDVVDIRFSPCGRQLCLILDDDFYDHQDNTRDRALSETGEEWRIVNVTENTWSRGGLFPPHEYCFQQESGWIEDSGGRKLLWLPPNWRMTSCLDTRWTGDFLALVDARHPEPIIVKFKPQPLLPHSSIHSSDICDLSTAQSLE